MTDSSSSRTPLMQQYWRIKDQHPNRIVFFRLGDFYELFAQDAIDASQLLDLTLTHRGTEEGKPIPMAGIPCQSLEIYLKRLLNLGKTAVVCEQVGQPTGKGPMERVVKRIFTPGTVNEAEFLSPKEPNYLMSIATENKKLSIAWVDVSEGHIRWKEGEEKDLLEEILLRDPKEILGMGTIPLAIQSLSSRYQGVPDWYWNEKENQSFIQQAFPQYGKFRDLEMSVLTWRTIGCLIRYVCLHMGSGAVFTEISQERDALRLMIDSKTRKHLGIESTNDQDFSLLSVLQQTCTAGGARLLRKWMNEPSRDYELLTRRQEEVAHWKDRTQTDRLHQARMIFCQIGDIERMTSKIMMKTIRPRELIGLKTSCSHIGELRDILSKESGLSLISHDVENTIEQIIAHWICDEPSNMLEDGKVIRPQVHPEFQEICALMNNHEEVLLRYAEEQQSQYGIAFKSGSNHIHGFYLECSKQYADRVPEHFVRIQTLKNVERYQTPELRRLQTRFSEAHRVLIDWTKKLYEECLSQLQKECAELRILAQEISRKDVTQCFATVSLLRQWATPQFRADQLIEIEDGRHPLLEQQRGDTFIPNDCRLTTEVPFWMITGPNMGGKSTFMRQVALIVYLAHLGCDVPARSCQIGIIDAIFTRIGAHDRLQDGQSTFMVELNETARICRQATKHSLVLIDEMGRGTSTYDGMALARATAEFFLDRGCYCLFSTHYHELTDLQNSYSTLGNYCVSARVEKNDLVFEYQVRTGAAEESFGLYVAQQAGLPSELLQRAWAFHHQMTAIQHPQDVNDGRQDAITKLLSWDLNQMSPKELWKRFEDWQESILAHQD